MPEQATNLISPFTLDAIDQMLRQKRATGQYVSDADERNAYQAALEAQAQKALQQRALDERRREFNLGYQLQKKAYDQSQLAGMINAPFELAKFGMGGYDWYKKNWGTPAVPADMSATATPSNVQAAAPAAVFNPSPAPMYSSWTQPMVPAIPDFASLLMGSGMGSSSGGSSGMSDWFSNLFNFSSGG